MDSLKRYTRGSVFIISIKGRILQEDSASLEDALEEALKKRVYRIVLDFMEVKHICSTALGVMVSMKRRVRRNEGDIKIALKNGEVKKLLELTMLDKIFELFDMKDSAIKAFDDI